MLNCQTFRERLDCLAPGEQVNDAEIAAHLESCEACQQFAENRWPELQELDRKIATSLRNVSIPENLQADLLALVAAEDAPQTLPISSAKQSSKPRPGRLGYALRMGMTAVALVLLSVVSFMLMQPETVSPLNYAEARQTLTEQFEQIDEATWSGLPAFDETFVVSPSQFDSVLRRWDFFEFKGVDLGNGVAHDVAAAQFRFKKWSGTVVVLPESLFEKTPSQTHPGATSSGSILEWTDGELVYLVFVDEGSAQELSEAMLGAIG